MPFRISESSHERGMVTTWIMICRFCDHQMSAMLSLRLKKFDKSLLHTINQEACETEERGVSDLLLSIKHTPPHHTWNFVRDDHADCLKDPRQQSTKLEELKNINHELSKTSKIIQNDSLSMILGPFEHHHKNPKFQKKYQALVLPKKNTATCTGIYRCD